jgi:hypothetical protein
LQEPTWSLPGSGAETVQGLIIPGYSPKKSNHFISLADPYKVNHPIIITPTKNKTFFTFAIIDIRIARNFLMNQSCFAIL